MSLPSTPYNSVSSFPFHPALLSYFPHEKRKKKTDYHHCWDSYVGLFIDNRIRITKGNHTGYGQWTGTKVSAQQITDLYDGLRQSYLDDFDMMLSGYIPGAEAVVAVGNIAKELKQKHAGSPNRFFWVLDPVMGDNGRIYVAEEVVPAYKGLIGYADLILPNQFEAE